MRILYIHGISAQGIEIIYLGYNIKNLHFFQGIWRYYENAFWSFGIMYYIKIKIIRYSNFMLFELIHYFLLSDNRISISKFNRLRV